MMFSNLTFAPPEIGIPPRTRAMRICVSSWLPTFAVAVIVEVFLFQAQSVTVIVKVHHSFNVVHEEIVLPLKDTVTLQ